MATLFDNRMFSVINLDSSIEAGALLWWFSSGTETPVDTYSDVDLTIENMNPVVADANGRFPTIWLAPGSYKYILTDADSTPADPIITQDPFIASSLPPDIDPGLAAFLSGDAPLPLVNGGTGDTTILPISNGGTGSQTAPDALTALGAQAAMAAATGPEIIAGTVTGKYIDPAGLSAAFTTGTNANGRWRKSVDGSGAVLIEQWGAQLSGANGWSADYPFPIAFPTAVEFMSATSQDPNFTSADGNDISASPSASTPLTAFRIGCSDGPQALCYWEARGR